MVTLNRIGATTFGTPSDREIQVTRTFDAPRPLVFAAWTEPEHLKRWMTGPDGWTMPVCEVDLRAGGRYRYVYRGPDGMEMQLTGGFSEVSPPERVVASESWGPEWPETVNTIEFTEHGDRTTVTLTMLFTTMEGRDAALASGMDQGMAASYDRLAEHLRGAAPAPGIGTTRFTTPTDRDIVAVRAFAAPRALVWEMFTRPEHVSQWLLGPDGWTMPVCEMDVQPGGRWRWGWRKNDGTEMEMTGEYLEVQAPERLVNTENWGGDWAETVNTTEFAEADGRTIVTCTVHYPSKAARDRAMATGMYDGWNTSYDRLEHYLDQAGAAGRPV